MHFVTRHHVTASAGRVSHRLRLQVRTKVSPSLTVSPESRSGKQAKVGTQERVLKYTAVRTPRTQSEKCRRYMS